MSHFESTYGRRKRRMDLIRRSVKTFRGSRTKFAYQGVHFAAPGKEGNSKKIIDVRDDAQHPYFWTRVQTAIDLPRESYVRTGQPLRMRDASAMFVEQQRQKWDEPSTDTLN